MDNQDRPPRRRRWQYTPAGPWDYATAERTRDSLITAKRRNAQILQTAVDRGDTAAITQCRSLDQGITAALAEVSQRNHAAITRMTWEHDHRSRESAYITAYYRAGSILLREARAGILASDWRNRMRAQHAADTDLPDVLRATQAAVLDDLTALPPQPWEPYAAGGDWRAALDAWYHDSLTLHDLYYDDLTRPLRAGFWPTPRPEHLAQRDQDDAQDNELAALSRARECARIEALYRGGLAAGGHDEDWIGWCHRYIETWDGRDTAIPLMVRDPEDWRITVESLPDYWRHTGRPADQHRRTP